MPGRSRDWLKQAAHDLEQARASQRDGRHDWACFAAQQAAENAAKAMHLARGQDASGHVVATLLAELPQRAPAALIDKARVLDNVATRYADGHAEERPSSTTESCKASRRSTMPVRSSNTPVPRSAAGPLFPLAFSEVKRRFLS